MQSTLFLHHVHLSAVEQRHLVALNSRMERYFRKLMTLSWGVRESAREYSVGCTVHSLSGYYRARATAASVGSAVDLAFERIVRQRRRKQAAQLRARHRDGAAAKSNTRERAGGVP